MDIGFGFRALKYIRVLWSNFRIKLKLNSVLYAPVCVIKKEETTQNSDDLISKKTIIWCTKLLCNR